MTSSKFREKFPTDASCLAYLYDLRFSNIVCPKCESIVGFKPVKNRRAYQCPACSFQIYPTKDTVFEKTTTPLSQWFYAMYLHCTTKKGVSSKHIERSIGTCYNTSLRISHRIRIMMNDNAPLNNVVRKNISHECQL